MAIPKVIDLDAVTSGVFIVKIKGEDYKLPKSVPLDTAFQMMELFRELQDGTKEGEESKASVNQIERLFELIASLFVEKYPLMTADVLKKQITLQQCSYMLKEVVGEIFDMESVAGNP